ncbi:MAG: bifunctional oligoribonuclease/PAP phosphatase NrnA [Candidatus Competibacteraceae bacterium]|nr:bifunctional oligoribonuclease/PAP phosphatase NrnA [Candidatus Competibacteraceae bacterium]
MDFSQVKAFIRKYDKFIITAHETPDGDALGSEYAMLQGLRALGKTAVIRNADPAPEKYGYMDPAGDFQVLSSAEDIPADLDQWALLVLDVADFRNIGQVRTLILPKVRDVLIIDHHEGGDKVPQEKLISVDASSTCEIIYLLLGELGVELDYGMAIALYTGIVFDTGSFAYPKTTALTLEIGRHLVSLGVNANEVHRHIYESDSIGSLRLMSRVMSTLELHGGDRIAVLSLTRSMLAETGGRYEEADQLINIPLRSKRVVVSIFFKENEDGLVRCSMRSKGEINVAHIAQARDGGGHKNAAGFKCRRPVDEVKRDVLSVFLAIVAPST